MKTAPPIVVKRRKVSVEVYFVLYLSAIVLLLGTTTSKKSSREGDLEEAIVQLAPDFRVDAEKVALVYRFIPAGMGLDTAGVHLQRDSVNVIRARGSFSSVRFNIVAIEDTATGQRLPVESATLTRDGDRSALFTWRPRSETRNSIYRVTVAATATPLPPDNITRPEIRDRIARILRERTVTDSVTFTVNVFAVNGPEMGPIAQAPPTNRPADSVMRFGAGTVAGGSPVFEIPNTQFPTTSGSINFRPAQMVVNAIPQMEWQNDVYYSGVSNIKVTGGSLGTVTDNRLEIRGTAGNTGEQTVTITGETPDHRPVTAQFTVKSRKLDDPQGLQDVYYAGMPYSLDFRSSTVPDPDIWVDIVLNGKVVAKEKPARLTFTLETAGTVRFIRYVRNQKFDNFDAGVLPLPVPDIYKPVYKKGDDMATIQTVSYGIYKGKPNTAELKVAEGNADDPELVGNQDLSAWQHVQTWRIRRHDHDRRFTFSLNAIDQRGSGSGKSRTVDFDLDQ